MLQIYGAIISMATALLLSSDTLWHQFNQRVERMKVFMWQHKLDPALRRQISTWMDYQWSTSRGIDVDEMIGSLPTTLNRQVTLSLTRHVLHQVPLFSGVSEEVAAMIMSMLSQRIHTPGDVIVDSGTYGDEMFIVKDGIVGVLGSDNLTCIARLEPGASFGELAVLFAARRSRTVMALSYCKLYVLLPSTLEKIFETHPACIDNLCSGLVQNYDMRSLQAHMQDFEANLFFRRSASEA